jgi:lipopolysaccharide export system permease protein
MIKPTDILFRYVLKEMLTPFVISVAFFIFVFLMARLLDIINYVVNYQVKLTDIFWMLVYTMPFSLQFVLPMSVMMAILLTFMRLSGDNEVVAMKSGGVSVYNMLPPVMLFGLLVWVFTFFIVVNGIPWGATSLRKLTVQLAESNFEIGIKPRVFNDSFDKIIFYVNEINPSTKTLTHVFIEDQRQPNVTATVVAPRGQILKDPDGMGFRLRLYDGTLNKVDTQNRSVYSINFSTYDISLSFKQADTANLKGGRKLRKEMTLSDFKEYFARKKNKDVQYYVFLMEYYRRFSLPVACLPLALVALSIGFQAKRKKRAWGLGLALFYFILYYLLLTMGRALGETGAYPPVLGMWMPNIVLGIIGVVMVVRTATEKSFEFDWLTRYLPKRLRPTPP